MPVRKIKAEPVEVISVVFFTYIIAKLLQKRAESEKEKLRKEKKGLKPQPKKQKAKKKTALPKRKSAVKRKPKPKGTQSI